MSDSKTENWIERMVAEIQKSDSVSAEVKVSPCRAPCGPSVACAGARAGLAHYRDPPRPLAPLAPPQAIGESLLLQDYVTLKPRSKLLLLRALLDMALGSEALAEYVRYRATNPNTDNPAGPAEMRGADTWLRWVGCTQ
jgi:hypothetical protein